MKTNDSSQMFRYNNNVHFVPDTNLTVKTLIELQANWNLIITVAKVFVNYTENN